MNGVFLDLGFIQIYWYSICIVLGMIIGMVIVYREAARRGIGENEMTDIIFYTIIFAIIGARLYYVVFDWDKFSGNLLEIFEIWHGGLAIHGAIIFGGLFLILHTKRRKLDTLRILDICSIGLIIGQAIGRWGNFFNQEVFGKVVSQDFLKSLFIPDFIIEGMNIGGAYHHPLFLYESLWCLLGFIVLLIFKRRKYTKTGQLFGIYCMWYSLGRFVLEGMRVEDYNLMFGTFKVAKVVSIIMFFVGGYFVVRRFRTSRFAYLYNDDRLKDQPEEERIPITSSSGDVIVKVENAPTINNNVESTVGVEKRVSDELTLQTAPIMNNVEHEEIPSVQEEVVEEPVQQEIPLPVEQVPVQPIVNNVEPVINNVELEPVPDIFVQAVEQQPVMDNVQPEPFANVVMPPMEQQVPQQQMMNEVQPEPFANVMMPPMEQQMVEPQGYEQQQYQQPYEQPMAQQPMNPFEQGAEQTEQNTHKFIDFDINNN